MEDAEKKHNQEETIIQAKKNAVYGETGYGRKIVKGTAIQVGKPLRNKQRFKTHSAVDKRKKRHRRCERKHN